MAIDTKERLLTPKELSEYIDVPESTLAVWRCRGRGPDYVKAGVRVRYRESAVEKWLDQSGKEAKDQRRVAKGGRA